MNLSKLFLILNLFLFNCASLIAGEWIKGSRFGQLVNYVGAYASAQFSVEGLLPSDLGTEVKLKIMKEVPRLGSIPGLASACDSEFVDKVKEELISSAMSQSMVDSSNLICARYEQKIVEKNVELRQMTKGEKLTAPTAESVVRTYWRDRRSGVLYDLDEATASFAVGYDSDKIREVLSLSTGLIAAIVTPIETGRIEQEHSAKYIGRARYTLNTCVVSHPFHSGCIRKALALDSRCPTCRIGFTKKNLVYSPDYKKGEECVICIDSIEPIAATTTKNVVSKRGEKRARL